MLFELSKLTGQGIAWTLSGLREETSTVQNQIHLQPETSLDIWDAKDDDEKEEETQILIMILSL